MQDKPGRRRFIAGAVCPRCGKMDKILVDWDTNLRECVACDFSEERPRVTPPADAPARDLPTRVSRPAARRVETPAQAVTLVDSRKKED